MRLFAPPEDQDIEEWADAVAESIPYQNEATVLTYGDIREVMMHSLVRRGLLPLSSQQPEIIRVQKL